jgi:hypothetical protein
MPQDSQNINLLYITKQRCLAYKISNQLSPTFDDICCHKE